MNVVKVTESKYTAREKFLEYRRAVQGRHSDEDKAIMEGYRYLSRGKQLINLIETFRATGMNDRDEPRLAIARASARTCTFEWTRNQWCFRTDSIYSRFKYRAFMYHRSTFSVKSFTRREEYGKGERLTAQVPIIPPKFRPGETQIEHYGILWEADWHHAPKDPLLVRFIHPKSPLVVLVAQWDLTELERAVMEGRI